MALLSTRAVGDALLVMAAVLFTVAAGAQPSLEDAVKANFLYKFAPFVEWPPGAFASPSAPFLLCIAGADPFGSLLDNAVRGVKVGEHPVEIRRLPAITGDAGCHLLFIPRAAAAASDDAMAKLAGKPVLTVADDGAGPSPAILRFVIRDGHVRFSIDLAAAEANKLTLSSKLLALAVSVRRNGR